MIKNILASAFETTEDDVLIVLESHKHPRAQEIAEATFKTHILPRQEEIAKAALAGSSEFDNEAELEAQTRAAQNRIAEILKEVGILSQPD